MQRRRQPVSASAFVEGDLGPGILKTFALLVVVCIVATAGYTIALWINNSSAQDRIAIEKTFYSYGADAQNVTAAMRKQRKAVASYVVKFHARSEHAVHTDYTSFTDFQLKEIKKVAKTGDPLQLSINQWGYADWFEGTVGHWYVDCIFWIILGAGGCASFMLREEYRLADLPWQRPWPKIVTLALGPFAWVAMPISYKLLKSDPPLRTTEEYDQQGLEKRYRSDPKGAKQKYISMRSVSQRERIRGEIRSVEQQIQKSRTEIAEASQKLDNAQDSLGRLRAQRRELEASLDEEAVEVTTLPEAEFERLMELPGVIAIQPTRGGITVVVRATYRQMGFDYDLGDWSLTIDSHLNEFRCANERNAVRPSWEVGRHPAYGYPWGGFCFGERMSQINRHVQRGQYLQAIELAINCLNSVNTADEAKVHLAFRRIES